MGMYLDNVSWMHLIAHCGVRFLDAFDTENVSHDVLLIEGGTALYPMTLYFISE